MAVHHFSVNEKHVWEWRKRQWEIVKLSKSKKAARGRQPMFDVLEKSIADWIQESRLNGHIVTHTAIWIRTLYLVKMLEFAVKKPADFVALFGCCNRFMIQHNLRVIAQTKLAQKLPKELLYKIESFQRHLINLRKKWNFKLSQIGNMDETLISFDLPTNFTVNNKGEKIVFIKITRHEKCHFTVVLGCMADGTCLPPAIIFKQKLLPKGEKFQMRLWYVPTRKVHWC